MPLKRGSSQKTVSSNIKEFHGGEMYKKMVSKHGKATADRMAVAAAMHKAGKSRGK